MQKLILLIGICFLLLAGCRQQQADLPRLVELDSLIAVAPDSAAALLEAIPDDSLPTAAARAYHALLLTQAKYKAYIHAYRLDTINLAVDYYADGHDPDKRTRSLLYKGCVMEELPQLDSAMYYYKYAEDMATQSGDTYHRGYALMRMTWLYQSQYAIHEAIETTRKSLDCFKQINKPEWRLNSTLSLATLYQTVDLDSSFYFINQALNYSLALDSARYDDCLSTLASCHLLNKDYRACIMAANASIRCCTMRDVYFRACNWAAQAYAKLGQKDSGAYYLELLPLPANKQDSVLLLSTKGILDNDFMSQKLSGDMADTLVNIDTIVSLTNASKRYDQFTEQTLTKRRNRSIQLLLATSTIILLFLATLVYWTRKRKEHTLAGEIEDGNKIISSLKSELKASDDLACAQQTEIGQLNDELGKQRLQNQTLELAISNREAQITEHETKIQDLCETISERDKAISNLVNDQSRLIDKRDELLQQSAQMSQDLLSLRIKLASTEQERSESRKNAELLRDQIKSQKLRVMAIVNEMSQGATIFYQTLIQQETCEALSEKFRQYVNANFMSRLKGLLDVAYPRLAQRMSSAKCDNDDEDMVYLHFAGFSNEMMCCYLNLTNKKTISNKKRIIATTIMGKNASISQLAE